MADLNRRFLREAVRENLETIQGLPPRSLRRRYRICQSLRRGFRLVIVPALLLISFNGLPTEWVEPQTSAPPTRVHQALPTPLSFPAPRPTDLTTFPLGVKKVVLDPGHGGADPGARTPSGLLEKDITLDIARRLRALLQEAAFEVAMTRDEDETVSLRHRALIANTERGDLFVSIHVNSIPEPEHRGVETYYLGPTDDPRVEQIAGYENRGSGYSLADFRRLLEGVYTHVRRAESRKFAGEAHRGLVTYLSKVNTAIKDDGVKTAPFLVLVATEMPGILVEVSVLSNEEEARLLADPDYRQHIARGLFAGIQAYADALNRPGGHVVTKGVGDEQEK